MKQLRTWVRTTLRCAAVILTGAIAARLVMLTIDTIAARNGNPPGGEIFLPIYAALLPALGWYLRGAFDRATKPRKPKTERSNYHEETA